MLDDCCEAMNDEGDDVVREYGKVTRWDHQLMAVCNIHLSLLWFVFYFFAFALSVPNVHHHKFSVRAIGKRTHAHSSEYVSC